MTLTRGSRVLVVDDDAFIRHILQAMLEAEGCTVVLAENGADGLSVLKYEYVHNPAACPFKLMVLDVMMPKMTGLEMLVELRNDPQLHSLPVLMLTAEGKPEDVARGYAAGASFYMTKPFDRAQLLEGVTAALKGRSEPS
jgi:DNA-binding response OmpR family regulator